MLTWRWKSVNSTHTAAIKVMLSLLKTSIPLPMALLKHNSNGFSAQRRWDMFLSFIFNIISSVLSILFSS